MPEGLQAVYTDFQGLDALRREARDQSPASLRKVAQQFEALFTQMMLKSMREATPDDEIFGSDDAKFYQGMFDQQIALNLATKGGIGLSDLLVRQLSRTAGGQPPAVSAPHAGALPVAGPAQPAGR